VSSIKEAVYIEVFLNIYDNWRFGWYLSRRGLIKIEEMNTTHLENAINDLNKKRARKMEVVMSLVPDGDIINTIQSAYEEERDLIALKLGELQRELDSRSV